MKKLSLILLTSLMAVPLTHAASTQSHLGALIDKAQQSQVRQRRQTTPPAASAATPIQTSQPQAITASAATAAAALASGSAVLSTSPSNGLGLATKKQANSATAAAGAAQAKPSQADVKPEPKFQKLTVEVKEFMRQAQIIETTRQKQLPEDMRQKVKILIDKTKIDNHGNPITDKDGNPLYNKYNNDPTDLRYTAESQQRRIQYLTTIVQALQATADPEDSKLELVALEAKLRDFKNTQWETKEQEDPLVCLADASNYFSGNSLVVAQQLLNKGPRHLSIVKNHLNKTGLPFDQALQDSGLTLSNADQKLAQQVLKKTDSYQVLKKTDSNTELPKEIKVFTFSPDEIKAFGQHLAQLKQILNNPTLRENAITPEALTYGGASYLQDEATGDRTEITLQTRKNISAEQANALNNGDAVIQLSNDLVAGLTKTKDELPKTLLLVKEQLHVAQQKSASLNPFSDKKELADLTQTIAQLKHTEASLEALTSLATIARRFQKEAIIQSATNAGTYGAFNLPPTITANAWTTSRKVKTLETPEEVLSRIAMEIIEEVRAEDTQKRTTMISYKDKQGRTVKCDYLVGIKEHAKTLATIAAQEGYFTPLKDKKTYQFNGTPLTIDRKNDHYKNPYETSALNLEQSVLAATTAAEKAARLLLSNQAFTEFKAKENKAKQALIAAASTSQISNQFATEIVPKQ